MERSELHPVEVLLLLGLLTVEALLAVLRTLVVPVLALLLVLRRSPESHFWRVAPEPPAAPPTPALPATPAPCLADVAESLLALPARELMVMAGTRRRLPKRELTALICAMPI